MVDSQPFHPRVRARGARLSMLARALPFPRRFRNVGGTEKRFRRKPGMQHRWNLAPRMAVLQLFLQLSLVFVFNE
jgi:hypothetical protein